MKKKKKEAKNKKELYLKSCMDIMQIVSHETSRID